MGIGSIFNYVNLLRATPKKINDETRRNFTIYLVGSEDLVAKFYDIITRGMTLDVPAVQIEMEKSKFIRILPMPLDETERKTLKADVVIYLLNKKDVTQENLLNYREVYKVNPPAHLFIEEPETYEEKDKLIKLMDSLNVTGREWINLELTEEVILEKADEILELNRKISMALAYRFPLLRASMSRKIIHGTGMQNLIVAMASSLPANLPVVGVIIGFLAAAGETTVITVNQLKMCLQLAGIYGLDMNLIDRLKELWPLVGTAFGLRTVSRAIAGFIPVAGAPIKGSIAYGGTFFIGETVRWYYEKGRKMTKEERRELYIQARENAAANVRNFLEKIIKKYPKESKEKKLDLGEIERELHYLEEDMSNINPEEELEKYAEPASEISERAHSKGQAIDLAVHLGEVNYELPNNPGPELSGTIDREAVENPVHPINPVKHWDITPEEDAISKEIIEAGNKSNWEKPGAAASIPGPEKILGASPEHTSCGYSNVDEEPPKENN
jgi:uncharacterized protein (DUF697 family)